MKLKTKIIALSVLMTFNVVLAQSNCVKVDQIAKWEVLDHNKTVIYDSQGNTIAFVIFNILSPSAYLKKSGETFRFFSPTLCRVDRVQVSGGMVTISDIEPIRK
jgi:hypothetical protein